MALEVGEEVLAVVDAGAGGDGLVVGVGLVGSCGVVGLVGELGLVRGVRGRLAAVGCGLGHVRGGVRGDGGVVPVDDDAQAVHVALRPALWRNPVGEDCEALQVGKGADHDVALELHPRMGLERTIGIARHADAQVGPEAGL